jgi:hypothetical protein
VRRPEGLSQPARDAFVEQHAHARLLTG